MYQLAHFQLLIRLLLVRAPGRRQGPICVDKRQAHKVAMGVVLIPDGGNHQLFQLLVRQSEYGLLCGKEARASLHFFVADLDLFGAGVVAPSFQRYGWLLIWRRFNFPFFVETSFLQVTHLKSADSLLGHFNFQWHYLFYLHTQLSIHVHFSLWMLHLHMWVNSSSVSLLIIVKRTIWSFRVPIHLQVREAISLFPRLIIVKGAFWAFFIMAARLIFFFNWERQMFDLWNRLTFLWLVDDLEFVHRWENCLYAHLSFLFVISLKKHLSLLVIFGVRGPATITANSHNKYY